MRRFSSIIFFLVVMNWTSTSFAQTDSLVFLDGQTMVGEIKSMNRGNLKVETEFSDSDFIIEWSEVAQIFSTNIFLISLEDGRRFDASLKSKASGSVVEIIGISGTHEVLLDEIVFINPVSKSFWDRLSASFDVGYNITKSNNLTQFNTRTYLAYLTKRWEASGDYNIVYSQQDSIDVTQRMDANLTFKLFLPNDFYLFVSNDFLSNDEQKLKLRSTSKLGLGNYVIHSNSVYWGIFGGAAYNNESFTETTDPAKQTAELFLGSEFNMFDTGDFGLKTSVIAYPNLSNKGRVRVDFGLDVSYDLPLDFYIKMGGTVNYDNQPVTGASTLDYVIQTGFGWSW